MKPSLLLAKIAAAIRKANPKPIVRNLEKYYPDSAVLVTHGSGELTLSRGGESIQVFVSPTKTTLTVFNSKISGLFCHIPIKGSEVPEVDTIATMLKRLVTPELEGQSLTYSAAGGYPKLGR